VDFNRYFEIGKGSIPIILSVPHGGFLKPKFLLDKESGVNIADKVTYLAAKHTLNLLKQKNIEIFYILNKIHRSKLDVNRPPKATNSLNQEAKNVEIAKMIHGLYHQQIKKLTEECISLFKGCFFIDFHGFTKPHQEYPDIIIGNIFGNTLNIKQKNQGKIKGENHTYWGHHQIVHELSKDFTLDDGLGLNNFNFAYSGGYITHQFYNKDQINAIQLEVAKYIRKNPILLRNFISDLVNAIEEIEKKSLILTHI